MKTILLPLTRIEVQVPDGVHYESPARPGSMSWRRWRELAEAAEFRFAAEHSKQEKGNE